MALIDLRQVAEAEEVEVDVVVVEVGVGVEVGGSRFLILRFLMSE